MEKKSTRLNAKGASMQVKSPAVSDVTSDLQKLKKVRERITEGLTPEELQLLMEAEAIEFADIHESVDKF
jgi:hypothetical protein